MTDYKLAYLDQGGWRLEAMPDVDSAPTKLPKTTTRSAKIAGRLCNLLGVSGMEKIKGVTEILRITAERSLINGQMFQQSLVVRFAHSC